MKIVTDSSVMFSVEDGARRGMTVLPLVVAIDGQTWLEYEDISAEEFLAKVRAGALPQSASPPPALTLAAYDTDDEVIHLAMADGLSGAYEVACGLVKQARHPERVQVVNTRTLCVPHRVLACTAVQLAGQGLDAAAVLEALDAQIATAHSYLMPARPAWGLALVAFYLGNACLLGAAAVWLISILKKDEAVEATGIQLTFIAALVQIVADVVFVIACAMAKIAQFGYYADPTSMTTAPTHVDSLMTVMVSGAGAPMFWGSIVSVIVAAACAFVAKKKVGASKTLMVVAAIGALATSVMFRVLIYQLGYPVVLMY